MAVFLFVLVFLGNQVSHGGRADVLGGPDPSPRETYLTKDSISSTSLIPNSFPGSQARQLPDVSRLVRLDYGSLLPLGALEETASPNSKSSEPEDGALLASGFFIMPAEGTNWGNLHNYNAVDIAGACGTPVMAAADGIVLESKSAGWNGGYGGYVLLGHTNKIKTRYAHLGATDTNVGNFIKQGITIGGMGSTGNVHGPTGCHLHFEIIGAKNPFVKN